MCWRQTEQRISGAIDPVWTAALENVAAAAQHKELEKYSPNLYQAELCVCTQRKKTLPHLRGRAGLWPVSPCRVCHRLVLSHGKCRAQFRAKAQS